ELTAITEFEQQMNPEVIFAEITALDGSKTDNISIRSHLRDYEIPVLINSSLPQQRIIKLSDLSIQVVLGKVVLRSKVLHKVVIPRLASAYNYRLSNLPLMQFLGDMQYQHLKHDFSFDPQAFVPGLNFYPRFMFQNVILSPARWIWEEDTLEDLLNNGGYEYFKSIAFKCGLARHFSLTEGDRELMFDMACDESISYFLSIISKRKKIVLTEFFMPEGNNQILNADGKKYVGQYLAFLLNKHAVYKELEVTPKVVHDHKDAIYLPGQEWVYYKIYGHTQSINMLLQSDAFNGFLCKFKKLKIIRCWFFVRYADPGPHLRLRFRIDERYAALVNSEMNEIVQEFIRSGLVSDFTIGCYQPELSRYDIMDMNLAEQVFQASSEFVLSAIQMFRSGVDIRLLSFSSVAGLAETFFPELSLRLSFAGHLCEPIEFRESVNCDNFYRQNKKAFEQAAGDPAHHSQKMLANKQKKLSAASDEVFKLRHLLSPERYATLAADLIHMHLNRLNAGGDADLEMNTYYYLAKYYRSLSSREKQKRSSCI
ncbi:MAG TPA: thiopeptide-type bacteriocin biosynthesis protein, partial [Pedobacter sp.]|nr:thiopeptide-type bacteriocin biosynthesis protein [Pedobacter sp.]